MDGAADDRYRGLIALKSSERLSLVCLGCGRSIASFTCAICPPLPMILSRNPFAGFSSLAPPFNIASAALSSASLSSSFFG